MLGLQRNRKKNQILNVECNWLYTLKPLSAVCTEKSLFRRQLWKSYVLLTVHLDICVWWNRHDALFIFSWFSHYTSTCFGLASSPSSGCNNLYMQQMVQLHVSHLIMTCRKSSNFKQSSFQYNTYHCCIYTLLPPNDMELASPNM
jgi:hypothetical protein